MSERASFYVIIISDNDTHLKEIFNGNKKYKNTEMKEALDLV